MATFINPSLFDSGVGKMFLINIIYKPQFLKTALSYGYLEFPQPNNPCIGSNDTINTYIETIVYGGSITFKKPGKITITKDIIDPNTGEIVDKVLKDLDPLDPLLTPEERQQLINDPELTPEITIESDGQLIEDYKKKIEKLNEKLTNLQDSLTSIITSASSYVTAVAIPFSMAAGIAGIMSTIGQLKGLKNIIGEVNEILEECNLSAANLDSLVPGVGTTITTVLDLIEGTVTVLTAIIPV